MKTKKKMTRVLSMVMTLALVLGVLVGYTPIKAQAATADVYPYGYNMSDSSITLKLPVTGSAYQWQKADEEDGSYADIDGATEETFAITGEYLADGIWYRCLVDGAATKAVEVLVSNGEEENIFTYPWKKYYLSNGEMAYAVDGSYFDIVGKFVMDGTTYWLQTSFSKRWAMNTDSATTNRYNNGAASLSDIMFSFDGYCTNVTVTLGEGANGFCISADTQLGNNDTSGNYCDAAALKAILDDNGKLQAIDMVGARRFKGLKGTEPALVIEPENADRFWVGGYWYNELFKYYTEEKAIENHDYNGPEYTAEEAAAEIAKLSAASIYQLMGAIETDIDSETNEVIYLVGRSYEGPDLAAAEAAAFEMVCQMLEQYLEYTATSEEDAIVKFANEGMGIEGTTVSEVRTNMIQMQTERIMDGTIANYTFSEVNGVNVVTVVESTDSGLSVSWLDKNPGDQIKFAFLVGSVADTGADEIAGEPIGGDVPPAPPVHTHEYVWVTDKLSTATENGSKHQECACGDKLPAVVIPAHGTATEETNAAGVTIKTEVKKEDTTAPAAAVENLTVNFANDLAEVQGLAVAAGDVVNVYLEVKAAETTAPAADKAEAEKLVAATADANIGMYVDLSLYLKKNADPAVKITDTLGSPLMITMDVPTALINNDSDIERSYKILRVHNGKADLLDTKFENGKLSFETSMFSTYAIITIDKQVDTDDDDEEEAAAPVSAKPVAPKTGDTSNLFVWVIALLGVSVLGVMVEYKRRKQMR